MGARGNIIAIIWVNHDPLHAPPPTNGRNNKILWVSKLSEGPLRIRATLSGTSQTVTKELAGGPGPSIINVPAAGCWSFSLSWAGHHDHLKLRYVAT